MKSEVGAPEVTQHEDAPVQKHIGNMMPQIQSPLSEFVKTLATKKGALSLAVEEDNSWSHQRRPERRMRPRTSIRSARWGNCSLSPSPSSPLSVDAITAIQEEENCGSVAYLSTPRMPHRKMFSGQTQSPAIRTPDSCSPGEFGLIKPVRRRSYDRSLEAPLLGNC